LNHEFSKAVFLTSVAVVGLFISIVFGVVPLMRGPPAESPIDYETNLVTRTAEKIGFVSVIVLTEDNAFAVGANAQFLVMVYLYTGTTWANNETISTIVQIIDSQGIILDSNNATGGRQQFAHYGNVTTPDIYYYWCKFWYYFDSEGFMGVRLIFDSPTLREFEKTQGTSEQTTVFSFPDIVNVRPASYLGQQRSEYQTEYLAVVVLGVSIISTIPALDRLADSLKQHSEKEENKEQKKRPHSVEPPTKDKWWKRVAKWDREYSKKHPRAIWIAIIVFSIALSLTFFVWSIPFGFFIILSADAMQTLIEAEATILGFFGLIAVYLLTSYDNRIDKLQEKILDSSDKAKIESFSVAQQRLKNRKIRATIAILSALISLILSFFLSIVTLGLLSLNEGHPSQTALNIAVPLIVVASMLLFIGVFSIFLMIYRIGSEPE
jgi:hypothetical protein